MKYLYVFDTAGAEATDLGGTYVQVALGGEQILPSFVTKKERNLVANVALGANFPLNTLVTLGAGIDVEPLRGKTVIEGAENYHKRYAFSGFLLPGFNLSSSQQVYGKLGYSGLCLEHNGANKRFHGPLFGLGYKQIINPDSSGWYTNAEANYVKSRTNNANESVKKTELLLGLGYRFAF